jgi:peptidoglycan/xylan/chitin deacetylase (PgdA/CDA1 family)
VEKSVRWQGGQPTTWSEKVETRRLPILMYHSVSPDHDNRLSRYRISPQQLDEQLCYLRDSGYYGIGIEEWVNAILKRCALPGRAIALSFDDGYKDFYEFAWPLLEKYGFTATVFLVSDYLGKTNEWDKPFSKELPLMSREEICFLQGKGVVFGSHSATHSALGSLSPEQVVEEAVRSRTTIQGLLGTPVQSIAYPYGSTSGAVANLCGGVGYIAGLSCQSGLSTLYDNPLHLPRIEIMGSDRLKDFVAKLTV